MIGHRGVREQHSEALRANQAQQYIGGAITAHSPVGTVGKYRVGNLLYLLVQRSRRRCTGDRPAKIGAEAEAGIQLGETETVGEERDRRLARVDALRIVRSKNASVAVVRQAITKDHQ